MLLDNGFRVTACNALHCTVIDVLDPSANAWHSSWVLMWNVFYCNRIQADELRCIATQFRLRMARARN